MNIDYPRVTLIASGLVVGVAIFFFAPGLGERVEAFSEIVVLVFTVLAGIELAVFALLGELRSARFRRGTSSAKARATVTAKTARQLLLFYCYIVTMGAIMFDRAFDLGSFSVLLERLYVSASFAVLVWSLGLPIALSRIQDDARGE